MFSIASVHPIQKNNSYQQKGFRSGQNGGASNGSRTLAKRTLRCIKREIRIVHDKSIHSDTTGFQQKREDPSRITRLYLERP